MMSRSEDLLRGLALAAAVLLLAASRLSADGMMMLESSYPRGGGTTAGWDLFHESSQQAQLSLQDGVETLLLRIGLEKPNERGVAWLIPIPATPAAIQVEVETEFPRSGGFEVSSLARERMEHSLGEARDAQLQRLWPDAAQMLGALFFGWHMMMMGEMSMGEGGSSASGSSGSSPPLPDVVVYKHVEREGMVSEVLTARTADGLYRYLDGKGMRVPRASLPVLERYIGKDHAFVASWLKPAPGARPERSLKVAFPAERLYFPLVPTSVYGDRVIPITIRADGFLTPVLPAGLQGLAKVEYYREGRYSSKEQRYTKVELQVPARLLSEDMWFEPGAPLRARYYDFLTRSGWLWTVLAGAASVLASLFAGWFVFKEWRGWRGALAMAAVGLCNLGSLAAIGLAVSLLPTKAPDAEDDVRMLELRAQGGRWKSFQYSWKCRTWDPRKLVYLPLFSILFLMFLSGFHAVLGAW